MNPLEQLADISVPQTVSYWPLAAGYWMLLGLTCILVALIIIWTTQYQHKNRAKKQALTHIKNLNTEDSEFAPKLQVTLKTVVAQYKGLDVASKSFGEDWCTTLTKLYRGKNTDDISVLTSYLYDYLYRQPNKRSTGVNDFNSENLILNNCEGNGKTQEYPSANAIKSIAIDWLKNLDTTNSVVNQVNHKAHPFGASKC